MIVGSQLLGPPIGAPLFAVGMAWPFAAELVCVLAGAVLVIRIQLPRWRCARPRPAPPCGDEIRDGVRWLWAHSAVRTLAITIFTFNITYGAAWSVLVLYTRQRLDLGEFGFGLVTTAMAVGGLVGTASYGWLERHVSLGNIMRVGLVIETLTHLSLALDRWAPGWRCCRSSCSARTRSSGVRRRSASGSGPCRRSSRAGSAAST